jgi:Zn-dependent protease
MKLTDLLIVLLVIALHEFGHLAAAYSLGINVKRVGVSWKGVYIVREAGAPAANLITTLAGPFANLLLAAAFPQFHQFATMSLAFGLCNLLPFSGSDGQRAWNQLTRSTSG